MSKISKRKEYFASIPKASYKWVKKQKPQLSDYADTLEWRTMQFIKIHPISTAMKSNPLVTERGRTAVFQFIFQVAWGLFYLLSVYLKSKFKRNNFQPLFEKYSVAKDTAYSESQLCVCSWLQRLKAVLNVRWQSLHMNCLLKVIAERGGAW